MGKLQLIFKKLMLVENIYMKFILTVIAITLIISAIELKVFLSDLTHVLWRIYQIV